MARPPGRRGRRPPRPPAGRVWTDVASKLALTSTTTSVPSDLRTWAWYFVPYGPPSSTRSTVPPGTFASAAALTLSAVSPVSAVSCVRCGCRRREPDGVLVVAAPASAAPPAANAETVAIAVSVFREV